MDECVHCGSVDVVCGCGVWVKHVLEERRGRGEFVPKISPKQYFLLVNFIFFISFFANMKAGSKMEGGGGRGVNPPAPTVLRPGHGHASVHGEPKFIEGQQPYVRPLRGWGPAIGWHQWPGCCGHPSLADPDGGPPSPNCCAREELPLQPQARRPHAEGSNALRRTPLMRARRPVCRTNTRCF